MYQSHRKRGNQNVLVICPSGQFILSANFGANSPFCHVLDCSIPNYYRLLWQFSVNSLFTETQVIIKISCQLYKMSMVIAARSEALEQTAFKIHGKCILVPISASPTLGAILEKQLVPFFMDIGPMALANP